MYLNLLNLLGQWIYESRIQWLIETTTYFSINVKYFNLTLFRIGRPKYDVVIPNTNNQFQYYMGDDLTP